MVSNPALALKIAAAGKTVVMLHHSGKNGSSRGSSRRHDVLDTVMKLERPFNYTQQEGAKFEVHFEKTRSFAGDAAEPVGLSHLYEGGSHTGSSLSLVTRRHRKLQTC